MVDMRGAILEMFDIKKFKYKCNQRGCDREPKKEVLIYEYRRKKKIGLVKLYLCEEHLDIRKLLSELRTIEPKMIIEKEEENIKT